MFQSDALDKSLVFRGGLTVGRLYIDDIIIWGDALARAYKLEKEISCYPWVVCDFEDKKTKAIYSDKYLFNAKRDFDGMLFVYYLNVISSKDDSRDDFIRQAVQLCDKQIL